MVVVSFVVSRMLKGILLILSLEGKAAWEALRSTSSTTTAHTTGHSASKAVESATTTAATSHTTHLRTKHLHENLGIDLHPSTHSTSTKSFHRVYKVLTAIVTSTFPKIVLAKK
jgi:hypothetical protein